MSNDQRSVEVVTSASPGEITEATVTAAPTESVNSGNVVGPAETTPPAETSPPSPGLRKRVLHANVVEERESERAKYY